MTMENKHEIQDGVCFYHGRHCPLLGLTASVDKLVKVLERAPKIENKELDLWKQRVSQTVSLVQFNLLRLR